MSKIKLTGSNSGYVELDSAADAGNLTLTLPTSGARLLSNTDNVFSGITTTAELDINGKIDVSTDIVGGRNLKVTGITTLSDDVTFTGGSYNVLWDKSDNALEFADNAKLAIGSGTDLLIYHDGNNSLIRSGGTGQLQIESSNNTSIVMGNAALSETIFKGSVNGAVELYHDNSKKIETTNTGAIVTGIITATEFIPTLTQLSHRNIIINGDMNIAQRGAQSTSDGIKTVDRFGIGFATGAIQQDQITLTSSDTPYAYGFRKSYRLTNTTASTAASAARDIRYQIEAQDIATSGWDSTSASSNITLSFWIKASVSQTYYVFHYVPDSQKNYNWNFTPSANTWTKITKTIPGASGVTFNNDNGPGMSIQIVAYYGNNFTASTDPAQNQWFTWAGTNRIPNMTSTWAGTTNATFEVTGMQLEVGSVATPFEHRSSAEELTRCMRYYEGIKMGTGTALFRTWTNTAGSPTNVSNAQYDFKVEKRATPTWSLEGNGTWYPSGTSGMSAYPSTSTCLFQRNDTTHQFLTDGSGDLCGSFSAEF